MEFPLKMVVGSEIETVRLAEEFSEIIKVGDVVALVGDLGTGKTMFVKNVVKEFGCSDANSPTFAIVNIYDGRIKINHFDFYRIKKLEELYDIGFEDYLMDNGAVTFIEWADLFTEVLPKSRYQITINSLGNSGREFTIEKL